jgi:hypothetical protein
MSGESPSAAPANGAILGIAFAILLVAVAAIVVHFPGDPSVHALPPPSWPPPPAALAAQQAADQQLLRDFGADADERAFVGALKRFHAEEVRLKGQAADARLREKLTGLEIAARRITGTRGPVAYRAAIVRLTERFRQALVGVRSTLADDSFRVLDGASGAEIPVIAGFQELAGTMLVDALRTGLLGADGSADPGALDVLRLLYMHRLAGVVRESVPRDRILTPFEVVTVLKWKVEAHPGLSMKEREELVPAIEALDAAWPREEVLGMVALRLGLFSRAVTHFDRALLGNPEAVALRHLQELAEREAKRTPLRPR